MPALLAARLAGIDIDAHIAHNVDAVLAKRYDPRFFRLINNPRRTARVEIEATLCADQVWGLSHSDVGSIADWGVEVHHLSLATGIGLPANERRGLIGFLGKGTWPPNYSAIEEMIGEVLPLVQSALGEAAPTFVIGGRGTERWQGIPGVKVAGPVASAANFYRSVDLVAVPRLGESTGISVKMLEAISNGVPVIVPTALASDAGLKNGFVAGDSSTEIAEQIVNYYTHPRYVESCASFSNSSISANENRFLRRMEELAETKGRSHV
ncbi:glycosyltransferase family 4 protein [Rhodococcus opacus]|nr:glycosyltransferase family 4 protein [Rhodococcus opacus]